MPDLTETTLDFVDVTKDRIATLIAESVDGNEKDVAFGDYDNDGDLDVAIANAHSDFGQRRNKLYRNDDGVLKEVSGTDVIPEFLVDRRCPGRRYLKTLIKTVFWT